MSNLEQDIRSALAEEAVPDSLAQEEGVFAQMAGLFRGRMRWMAVIATIECIVFSALLVLAAVKFFQATDTHGQILYATCVVLLALMLVLVKLWGWLQMTRYALQREIKRLELRVLELDRKAGD
ncbi:MAG: DUF6768 family protein [Phycisphaerales bacterium JB038]